MKILFNNIYNQNGFEPTAWYNPCPRSNLYTSLVGRFTDGINGPIMPVNKDCILSNSIFMFLATDP